MFITIRAMIHIITLSIDELQKEMNRNAPIVLFVKENANPTGMLILNRKSDIL